MEASTAERRQWWPSLGLDSTFVAYATNSAAAQWRRAVLRARLLLLLFLLFLFRAILYGTFSSNRDCDIRVIAYFRRRGYDESSNQKSTASALPRRHFLKLIPPSLREIPRRPIHCVIKERGREGKEKGIISSDERTRKRFLRADLWRKEGKDRWFYASAPTRTHLYYLAALRNNRWQRYSSHDQGISFRSPRWRNSDSGARMPLSAFFRAPRARQLLLSARFDNVHDVRF